jgi:hypothetical protein
MERWHFATEEDPNQDLKLAIAGMQQAIDNLQQDSTNSMIHSMLQEQIVKILEVGIEMLTAVIMEREA